MLMDNLKILNALENETRLKMFKHINEQDMHISHVARILDICVPVASKHAAILEDANLIERKVFGKTHVLSSKNKKICKLAEESKEVITRDYQRIFDTVESLKRIVSNDDA
ncbi:ArsR/SmtB family transcription factor [Methanolobus psychrotolerans]|uniref:ArsR/SmtB family transcription factor n=1 Tax=Methanolobus psychrotolerans TaxID=1874706 RepID=UPI000B9157A1|nr:winged helix-turn-helix domain-containing protein [Methanolobus psychrotolerans]